MSRSLVRTCTAAIPLLVLAAACGDPPTAGIRVERETVGDTAIVRTLAGSVWGDGAVLEPEVRIGVFDGEDHYMLGDVRSIAVAPDGAIYAMDTQVPALRKYGPDGRYLETLGREGEGPGEYRGPDGGLAVLPDGRVLLRDPRNARIQVYGPDGEPVDTWPIRGNFNTGSPMVVDTAGRPYTQTLLNPEADVREWRPGMVGFDPATGEPVDTVAAPAWPSEEPRLMAQHTSESGTNTSLTHVPFSPEEHWVLSPLGHAVGGLSTRYAIDQFRGDSVLRIERRHDPVAVEPGERQNQEDRTRWQMRQTQPDWRWNGPAIPDAKPPYRDLFVGKDGRIWVLLHQPGERIPDEELDTPDGGDPDPRPPLAWREPIVFDVFEPDGTYLGPVRAPAELSLRPAPVFDGDRVWAVVRDELDVPYLVRFKVRRADDQRSPG